MGSCDVRRFPNSANTIWARKWKRASAALDDQSPLPPAHRIAIILAQGDACNGRKEGGGYVERA